jgi:hypothetical protein
MLSRFSRNPEKLVANTGGNPIHGRRVCRAVRPVMVDNGILVVEGLDPVDFLGSLSNTPLWPLVHLRREVGCGPILSIGLLRLALHLQKAVTRVNQAMDIRGRCTLCEYIDLLLLARGVGASHIRQLQSTSYSGVGSGSPGTSHLSYVSLCWARSKGGRGVS